MKKKNHVSEEELFEFIKERERLSKMYHEKHILKYQEVTF